MTTPTSTPAVNAATKRGLRSRLRDPRVVALIVTLLALDLGYRRYGRTLLLEALNLSEQET